MRVSQSKTLELLLFIASIMALCMPAVINGYPIVNPDSGTYIESGFVLEVPADRPITYGILTRLFSINGLSLWTVIIMQAIVIHYIIRACIKSTIVTASQIATSVIAILLALFSTVSWVTSELIADIYTPIMLLSVACILNTSATQQKTPVLLYVVFFVTAATHASHLSVSLCILLLIWLSRKLLFEQSTIKKQVRSIYIMTLLSVSTCAINASVFSKSSAAFMTAAMINKGIVTEYLQAVCGNIKYEMCKYKDDITTDSDYFLWNAEGPLAKMGGWTEAREACSKINTGILTTYPYNWHFAKQSFHHTLLQAAKFNVGDGNEPQTDTNGIYKHINKFVSNAEVTDYLNSKQNNGKLATVITSINRASAITIICSLAIIAFVSVRYRRLINRNQFTFLFITLLGVCINAAQCATFSLYNGRYGAKVIWLIPLCAMLLILSVIHNKKRSTNSV